MTAIDERSTSTAAKNPTRIQHSIDGRRVDSEREDFDTDTSIMHIALDTPVPRFGVDR